MRTKSTLTAADGLRIIAAGKVEAEKNGWNVSIAVVDESGFLLAFERMDLANPQSADISIRKAWTAAAARVPTKALEDIAKDRPGTLAFAGRLPVQGGMPVKVGADCVGAVGVSGVASHQDEQVAQAGILGLGDLKA